MTTPSPISHKRKHNNGIPANATFVWARDGEGAAEHPAYLLPSPPTPTALSSSSSAAAGDDDAMTAAHDVSNDDGNNGGGGA